MADQLHGETPEAVEAFAAAIAALTQRAQEPEANSLGRALEAKRNKHTSISSALHGGGKYRGVCYLCGRLGATEVDHIVSVADGGTGRMDNLASCHPACHSRKHREPEWAAEWVTMALKALRAK